VREGNSVTPWETFRVVLTNPVNGVIGGTGFGTGTIQDDDTAPRIYADDATVPENGGPAVFRIRLLGSSAVGNVTVRYTTNPGTATSPADYTHTTGTAVFAPKQTEVFVNVPIVNDIDCEGDEQFTLRLSNPTGGNIFDNTGVGTIQDDDDGVVTTVTLTASPNPAKASDLVTLRATFAPLGATGTVEFFDGANSLGVFPVVNDTVSLSTKFDEGAHALTAAYSGDACRPPANSNLVNLTVGALPTVAVFDTSRNEGEAGVVNMAFRVKLSSRTTQDITMDYQTQDGTALAGVDYVASSGTFTIPANSI
jgi:hypothetical protein